MLRVLQVVDRMDRAGQETFIMNVYRHLDRSSIQFDFVEFTDVPAAYDQEILDLGGRIYRLPPKGRHLWASMQAMRSLVASQGYKIVHRHYSNSTMYFELLAAKQGGADCLIAHSHNSTQFNTKLLHQLCRNPLYRLTRWHLACSEDAGLWMFGNHPFDIIPNGIDLERYHFDPQKRNAKRRELGLGQELLIGHVGRFTAVKNQAFILSVFQRFLELEPDARLILVGEGEDRADITRLSQSLPLTGHVIIPGSRADVPELMMAMDAFIMPSLYEGLPLTLVEAQAASLPCLVADTISPEAKLTDKLSYMSLQEGPQIWAVQLRQLARQPRLDQTEAIRRAGYDIREVSQRLRYIYLNASGQAADPVPPAGPPSRS
ncbi:MAG: glycosyltransferase family 1 protein [Oscillospiraceae bacterium]|nr:glycosyltransferase family 1 protein [Oscillospiraceae bacterium]MDD4367932.1 glycosyltransferase family 1 protein [Oscillospiraceae bacterium]